MTTRKPWTPDDDARLIALREAGQSINAIGKALGRGRGSISSRMNALGMFGKGTHRRWEAWEVDHLIAHYRHQDWPSKRLAAHYGRTQAAVRRKADYLGLQRPDLDYKTKPADVDQRIVTLAMADTRSEDIAETVGCSAAYVWVVLKKRPGLHRRWKQRLGRRRRPIHRETGAVCHG